MVSRKPIFHQDIPTTYKEALEMSDAENWTNAMCAEMGLLERWKCGI